MTWRQAQQNMVRMILETEKHSPPGVNLLDPHKGNDLVAWVNSYHPRPGGGHWNYESITRAARLIRASRREGLDKWA